MVRHCVRNVSGKWQTVIPEPSPDILIVGHDDAADTVGFVTVDSSLYCEPSVGTTALSLVLGEPSPSWRLPLI